MENEDDEWVTVKASTLHFVLSFCVVDKDAAVWGKELVAWREAHAELEAALDAVRLTSKR